MRSFFLSISIFTIVLVSACTGQSRYNVIDEKDGTAIVIRLPDARKVEFVCSCRNFAPAPAKKINNKMWSVTIPKSREFTYFFLVDGREYLPDCEFRQTDDFGSEICIHH